MLLGGETNLLREYVQVNKACEFLTVTTKRSPL